MVKRILRTLLLCLVCLLAGASAALAAEVAGEAHVQNLGWTAGENGLFGTQGQGLRTEGLRLRVENLQDGESGSIEYCAHVQNIGWQNYVADGAETGTTGQELRVEAVRLRLTGALSEQYDLYYRAHAENFGWLGWAANGAESGTAGFGARLEALETALVPKGAEAPGETAHAYIDAGALYQPVQLQAHVQNIGWMDPAENGAGTTGRGLHLEALKMIAPASVSAQAHVQNIGWQQARGAGEIVGTTGKNLQIEALRMHLEGGDALKYDVYYRVHAANVGWLGWAKNGADAGTAGAGYGAEAVEIRLVPKNRPAPGSTAQPFIDFNAPAGSAQPGVRTVRNFLTTALQPVGTTCYVWGGGWNAADDAAGPEAVTIGTAPAWKAFFNAQGPDYDYTKTRFQIHNGLDCSGYVGWAVYNVLNTASGGQGYVYGADEQAKIFAGQGLGTYRKNTANLQPGDIVSMERDGHVYIFVGRCADGSAVIAHASPPGVMLSGTKSPSGGPTQASALAQAYMRRYYPVYAARYGAQIERPHSYLSRGAAMHWTALSDPEGLQGMDASQVLRVLFGE